MNKTMSLLRRFANVYCDTAFMPEMAVMKIVVDGLGKKILTGSDFPITAYRSEAPLEIEKQYVKDALQLRIHEKVIKDGIQ
ncbi:hypothetical protein LQZ19_00470 [Treponema primitia]|uniref:hypothetical protein n=1 Tax=Treponema primitia TaxID=88058 RepID=UPI003980BC79